MVIPGSETNIFFETKNKMATLNEMMAQIVNDGISEANSPLNFEKYTL